MALIGEHLRAFSIIFIVWIIVFFIAGLYEKHTVLFKNRLPNIIFNAQVVNTFIAVLFFYLIPYLGITPKTNLFIYLIISFVLMLVWRIYGYQFISSPKKEKALIIGSGEEMKELISEVNNNFRYRFAIIFSVDLDSDSNIENHIIDQVKNNGVTSIIVDFRNKKIEPILPKLFRLISPEIQFFDINKIYEDIFDRVPISLLRYDWFLENISLYPKPSFDFFKRLMDIIVAVFLSIVSLIMVPFVWLLIKLEGGGPVFTHQERIGKDNKLIKLIKLDFPHLVEDPDDPAPITIFFLL